MPQRKQVFIVCEAAEIALLKTFQFALFISIWLRQPAPITTRLWYFALCALCKACCFNTVTITLYKNHGCPTSTLKQLQAQATYNGTIKWLLISA